MSVKSIKLETIAQRALLLGAGFVFLISVVFFVRWCYGYAIATQNISKEVAEFAVSLAPNASQTHYTLAILNEKTFLPEDLSKSLAEYEQATALAPNDYRLWFALGKSRERRGDAVGAELALKKAVELAPGYSRLRWAYGNILLRQGKTTEAFAEMRQAAETDKTYTNPIVAAAWQIFEGDIDSIKRNIGDSTQINFVLPLFLAKQNRLDEAFAIWESLPAQEKKTTFKENGVELFNQLIETKKYHDALRIQSQIRESDTGKFAVGVISNGSFETDIKPNTDVFGWQIADGVQPQIGFDIAQKQGGNQSLVIVFNSPTGQDFRALSQIVVVESGKSYGFEAVFKSNLKTSATLKWEIVDTSDGKVLAATEAVAGNADWTSLKTDFTVPENTQAVTIRLAREICKSTACPISGKIWFDDFNLISR
ncbi:MAG: carbohydrate binding domain-containing protein [Acidobacteriota bacterium]|nr:carbohydrate binding domain-containing protein [Acidobacteriota bacterium]